MDHAAQTTGTDLIVAPENSGVAAARARAAIKMYQAVAAATLPPAAPKVDLVIGAEPPRPAAKPADWQKLSTNTGLRNAVSPQVALLPSSRADKVTLG